MSAGQARGVASFGCASTLVARCRANSCQTLLVMSQISRPLAFDPAHPGRAAAASAPAGAASAGVVSRDRKLAAELGFDDDDGASAGQLHSDEEDADGSNSGRAGALDARLHGGSRDNAAAGRSPAARAPAVPMSYTAHSMGRAMGGSASSFGDASRLAAGGAAASSGADGDDDSGFSGSGSERGSAAELARAQSECARLRSRLAEVEAAQQADGNRFNLAKRAMSVRQSHATAMYFQL